MLELDGEIKLLTGEKTKINPGQINGHWILSYSFSK